MLIANECDRENKMVQSDPEGTSRPSKRERRRRSRWPWWGQLVLAVFSLAFLGALLIGLPVLSAAMLGGAAGTAPREIWTPMIAVLVGLTTVTVSGIFLFMTFRIDRGTRRTAKRTAQKTAKRTARKRVTRLAKELDGIRSEADKIAEGVKDAPKAAFDEARDEIVAKFRSVDMDGLTAVAVGQLVSSEKVRDLVDALLQEDVTVKLISASIQAALEKLDDDSLKDIAAAVADVQRRRAEGRGVFGRLFGALRRFFGGN